ncbi:hypothetical protein ACHAPT_010359 [Fusarium lateritium]
MSVTVASPIVAPPSAPSPSASRSVPAASLATTGMSASVGDSIVCAPPSGMASPTISRGTLDILPLRPTVPKSVKIEITKAVEVGHPLKNSHMRALLACYPSTKTVILNPFYFDMASASSSAPKTAQKPLSHREFLAPLQHSKHWSLVKVYRETIDQLVVVRHYDPIPCPQRHREVDRVVRAWARQQNPGWDVRVTEVSGPRASSSALTGLYVVMGADEFPVVGNFAVTWKPKSLQNAVLDALERYERAPSADSGVSMDEDDCPKSAGSSSGKRGDSKKGIGIGTAKRSKGLVRTSLSAKLCKESPASTPKKLSPTLSEQKQQPGDSPKLKVLSMPQSEQQQPSKEGTRLSITTTNNHTNNGNNGNNSNSAVSQPPTPSTKRPRSDSSSENPSGDSQVPAKKRCTPENRDSAGALQHINACIQDLSFPSPEQATAQLETGKSAMMKEKTRIQGARLELLACDEEFAKRTATYDQCHKDWKELSDKIKQDEKNLESWLSTMPSMNTMTSDQCSAQFIKAFESNLDVPRKILKEKHEQVEHASNLLRSAGQVCDTNKAKVERLEASLADKEAELCELMKREELSKLVSEYDEKLDAMKAKWNSGDVRRRVMTLMNMS